MLASVLSPRQHDKKLNQTGSKTLIKPKTNRSSNIMIMIISIIIIIIAIVIIIIIILIIIIIIMIIVIMMMMRILIITFFIVIITIIVVIIIIALRREAGSEHSHGLTATFLTKQQTKERQYSDLYKCIFGHDCTMVVLCTIATIRAPGFTPAPYPKSFSPHGLRTTKQCKPLHCC